MPDEDRTKYLKIFGIVFAVALIILLGTLVGKCHQGGSPQENEMSPPAGDDDVTHVVPARPQPVTLPAILASSSA